MLSGPKVSIVIPVYNGANYLKEAIDSALAQTYDNYEVIVVNDGSTDNGATEQIALSYGSQIRYFYKENGGVASALNYAIRNMEGSYFSWLSHDDIYLPEKIERQVSITTDEHYSVIYSDFEAIDADGKHLWTKKEREISSELFRYHILFSHPVDGCAMLIPRKIFDVVGLFDERLKTVQDYDMWYRIAKRFDYVHLPVVLSKIRFHNQQGSVVIKEECIRECSVFYRKAFDETMADFNTELFSSRISFCIRAAVFFERIHCQELSRYASQQTMQFLKTSGLDSFLDDVYQFIFLGMFRIKRTIVSFFSRRRVGVYF